MLELLVGCSGGDEETVLVTGSQTPDNARSGDCGVADGNDILEFGLEDTALGLVLSLPSPVRYDIVFCVPVEVLRSTYCDDRIGIGKCREDTNSAPPVSTCSLCAFAPPCTYSLEFSNCARTAMMCR